jgi:transposase
MLRPKLKLVRAIRQNFKTAKLISFLLNMVIHVAFRLPHYHPEINSIENIWEAVKQHARLNGATNEHDVDSLSLKVCGIDMDDWELLCKHVIDIGSLFLEQEGS